MDKFFCCFFFQLYFDDSFFLYQVNDKVSFSKKLRKYFCQGGQSDTWYEVTDEPLLWSPAGRGRRRGARVRFRAHHSAWSRAARLAAAAPGLVVCPHTERRTNYRLLLNVSTSTGTTPPGRAPPRPTVCNRHHSQWFPQHAADRQVRGPLAIQAIHHPHDLCNNLAYFVKVKTLKILISVMQYFLPRLHYRSCVLNSLKS